MKKILLGFAAIAMIAAFTSCNRTCTCTATTTQKVLYPSFFDYDQEEINRIETPTTVTTTGKYKGKCSEQNQNASQTTAFIQQTIEVVCK